MLDIDTMEPRERTDLEQSTIANEVIINDLYPDQKIKIGSDLSPEERQQIINFLRNNTDVFAWKVEDMEGISEDIAMHHLEVDPSYRPIQQKARNFSREKEIAMKEEVQKLLKAGIIREVSYPTWLANVVMVIKANKKWRMCVDFTDLNKACPKDWYPLPRIDKLVDAIAGHRILSFVDAYSGYHQIKMAPSDQEKTAFRAAGGIYCYTMMPFGLKNAGATYQRMVNSVFNDQIGRNVEAYIDDMVIKTKGCDHTVDMSETFANLRKNRMKLNPSKCAFGVTAGKFLGFMVSERGIEANPDKIQALINMEEPRNITELQRLNGRVTALGRFMAKSAEKSLPLFKALKAAKNFQWTSECSQAFSELKRYLATPPMLSSPIPGEQLYVYLAVSDRAVGSVLVREQDGLQKPVYYVSKALSDVETRYLDIEKVALSLVIIARKLRSYFEAHKIVVYTNVMLRQVLHRPDVAGRMMKWSVELMEFDITYSPRKSIQAQALADFIVETSFRDPIQSSDEEVIAVPPITNERPIQYWALYVDGSSMAAGGGAGIHLLPPYPGDEFKKAIGFHFGLSNNQAEYEALIAGLDMAKELGAEEIVIHSDSQLVVKQVNGEYDTTNPNLLKYCELAKSSLQHFKYWEMVQIDRADNTIADYLSRLANVTSDNSTPNGIEIAHFTAPCYDRSLVMPVAQGQEDWVEQIRAYISNGTLPDDDDQAKLLKKRASRYSLMGEDLFRRSLTRPLLKCVRNKDQNVILAEVHEGMCGGHKGARKLEEQILLNGYYWPTLRKDATAYTRRCDKCQRFAVIPRLPVIPQTPVVASWPFDIWGIDLLGPFPTGRSGCKHLIVAVDYFTKWIEAKPLNRIFQKNAVDFLYEHIWCRFGVSRAIVTDHGKQFEADFTEACARLQVRHYLSAVAHPEGNGQAEAANKLILDGLKTSLDERKGRWVDDLPLVLWAIRTSPRGSTGETPFLLAYGAEAMAPVEVTYPSLRVTQYSEVKNDEQRRIELDLLEERRLNTRLRMINYKQKVKQYHDKRLSKRQIPKIGDWVLRKIEGTSRAVDQNKLSPNWEGPYEVIEEIRPGTYLIRSQQGRTEPHHWHANHLKVFYR